MARKGGWGAVLEGLRSEEGEVVGLGCLQRPVDELLLGSMLREPLPLPDDVRPPLWTAAIGNQLQVSMDMFDALSESGRSGAEFQEKRKRRSMIATDMSRTFPDHGAMFSDESSPFAEALVTVLSACASQLLRALPRRCFARPSRSPCINASVRVCKCTDLTTYVCRYSRFRPEIGDVGYVQGMSYIAAMALMNSDV